MSTTVMPRIVRCLGCGYTQKDHVSYYRHKKTWNANHDLKKCAEMKAVMGNSFSAYKQLTWENETTNFRKLV
jgi:hypothetical protein